MHILARIPGFRSLIVDVDPEDTGAEVLSRILGSGAASTSAVRGDDVVLWHRGRAIDLSGPISATFTSNMPVIEMTGRLRGGGGDGGTTGAENR